MPCGNSRVTTAHTISLKLIYAETHLTQTIFMVPMVSLLIGFFSEYFENQKVTMIFALIKGYMTMTQSWWLKLLHITMHMTLTGYFT